LRPSPVSPQGGLAQRNPSSSPAGRDEETALPIGVLIPGRRLREDLSLEAAEAIEARLGLATPIDPVR
jgi:amidase